MLLGIVQFSDTNYLTQQQYSYSLPIQWIYAAMRGFNSLVNLSCLSEGQVSGCPFTPTNSLSVPVHRFRMIAERDPLHEMHEQERKVIWSLRHELVNLVPTLLPKLLDCVEWNDHKEVV